MDDLRTEYGGRRSAASLQSEVRDNLRRGYIGLVRPGLYYIVPFGEDSSTYVPDRFLIAHRLAPDAVIGYHSALELLGAAYAVFSTVYVLSRHRRHPFTFQGVTYQQVFPAKRLVRPKEGSFGVDKIERYGIKVRVTSRERTVVDCMDRLEYAGGLEEIFRSVEMLPYLDLDKILAYLKLLRKRTLYAEVGFLLDSYAEKFQFDEAYRRQFLRNLPKVTYYLGGKRPGCRYVQTWNLMVPSNLAKRLETH